jgi:glyoxylase-like metal-dependent hydrolase (beta-lactamase superfamily II)
MAAVGDEPYFRQLLAGRDFARSDQVAGAMVNFVYAVGDRSTGEAVLVDPAYAVGELVDLVEADGLSVVGALVTHYHPDHAGGNLMGHAVEGAAELLERCQVPVHVQADEAPWVRRVTGLGDADLVAHTSGDVVTVGRVPITLLHTPGHTPGSQCFLLDGKLLAGDTLFLQGCGRTDLPGGDPAQLYESLTTRLARVPDDTVLYPGHQYSPQPSAPMGATRRTNMVLRPASLEQWLALFS